MSPLTDLFPPGGYRFHLLLRRGPPEDFFRAQDASGRVLAERAHWLTEAPRRYAALRPEGAPLLDEFTALAADWVAPRTGASGGSAVHDLGAQFEPDILFLSADGTGQFRLHGGALCFPTGWALEDKIGHPLEFIHGVVPGLNPALGAPIQQFLSRLKPGGAVFRDNWGVALSDELNLHPARKVAPPELPVALDRLWLRVEHQVLLALPKTRGVVFGIRIVLHRLDEVAGNPAAAAGLRHALATMPPEVAAYKRLDAIREELARVL